MSHFTSPDSWSFYNRLSARVQQTADKYFALLTSDPKHPSLHLKKIGELCPVRVGLHYRAIGVDASAGKKSILWIWIGSHAEYDRFVKM